LNILWLDDLPDGNSSKTAFSIEEKFHSSSQQQGFKRG